LNKRGFEILETRNKDSLLPPGNPHAYTEHDAHSMENFPWLAWLSVCTPSQPLHTCSSAEYEKLEKSPWFLSNSWKHQCYQHSSCTKSKTQQLLGGKLTVSQLKTVH